MIRSFHTIAIAIAAVISLRWPTTVLAIVASHALFTGISNGQFCPSNTGDCLVAHGGPGCTDASCCNTVCTIDPICCKKWDNECAFLADNLCSALCGATAAGNCYAPNPTPSCSDAECCQLVCLADPFCCQTMWDGNCALLASFNCKTGKKGECGDPNAGSCHDPNGLPACNDETCCNSVCDIEPSCCNSAWDLICVGLANALCLDSCSLQPPFNTPIELEECNEESNDPCNGGTPQPLMCNESVAGNFRSSSDVDVYQLALSDENGDGAVRLRISLLSTIETTLQILADPCDSATPLLTLQADTCLEYSAIACLDLETAYLRIISEKPADPCSENPHYIIRLECGDYCGEPCENQEDCLTPHDSPGCDDPTCCELVCISNPQCCQWQWDSICTQIAVDICGGDPPENDACQDATPAFLGNTPFRQSLSTPESIDPNECMDPTISINGDVWFSHTVDCDSQLLIGTCSTIDFDSIIEIFRGTCEGLELLSCSDDTPACAFGTSLAQVDSVACGETLLIRVSGKDDSFGSGDLTIICLGSACPCPADLNNDNVVNGMDMGFFLADWNQMNSPADFDGSGQVDGIDLGIFLANWGPCS